MTFKEYFLATKTTTKSCLKIASIVFTIVYVLILIGGKSGEEETFTKVYNSIVRFVFIYGLTLFIWLCALISAYKKANNTIKLFNSIPFDKDKFCLQLQHRQQNIKYNYLEFEIVGLYENKCIVIDKFQKNIRIILCVMFNSNSNFQIQKLSFDKKYKSNNIELNGYGLLKKITEREWDLISANEIEKYIRELADIARKESPLGAKK